MDWKAILKKRAFKRQKKRIEAVPDLEKKTLRMMEQSRKTSLRLKKESNLGISIQSETLEANLKRMNTGLDEIQQIEANARRKRQENQNQLQAIKNDFNKNYHVPDKRK